MKSRKEAFEDAISSAKAAVAEGIVPGGGLALLRAIAAVDQEATKCEGDERTGLLILKRALGSTHATDCGELIGRWRRRRRQNETGQWQLRL